MSENWISDPNEWERARNKEEDPFMQDGEVWSLPIIVNMQDLPDGEVGERTLDDIYLHPEKYRTPYSPC